MKLPHILRDSANGIQMIEIEDELFSDRKIFLTEEVNAASASGLLKQLMVLELENEGEITLYIDSPGGSVQSGLAVYDYILSMKSPVRTVCTGIAASMGAILFLAGQNREMLPNSKIMIHDPSSAGSGGAERALDMRRRADELLKSRQILCGIIAERTGKSRREVYTKTKGDTWFNAKEAIKFGLATKITGQAG